MEVFLSSLQSIFPMFYFMAIGYAVREFHIMTVHDLKKLNVVAFKVFIPVALFINIYLSNFKKSIDVKLMGTGILYLSILFVAFYIIVPIIIKRKSDASVVIQGIYRSNYVLFGLTLAQSVYPNKEIGVVSAFAAFLIPVYNIYAVILFETMSKKKFSVKSIAVGVIKNPLIIGAFVGIVFSFFEIPVPDLIIMPLKTTGIMAAPIALIALGGIIYLKNIGRNLKLLLSVSFLRLIAFPLFALIIFVLLGYRDTELVTILAAFGSPTAVSSVPMASALGGNGELAGEIVAITTVLSIFTIFMWVFILRFSGLII